MIVIEHADIIGMEHAIRGARNPLNSWKRSDSEWVPDDASVHKYVVGHNDMDLMSRLSKAGTDHRKFMRMIVVYCDIIAPLYWWKEYDTYKVGTVANSTSTMHKIHSKPFSLDDFSCDHMTPDTLEFMQTVVDKLEEIRLRYMEEGKRKEDWYDMIQFLPSSYNQRRTVMMNYEVLANIYKSRKNHKLDEWHTFCDWVKTLPYNELIINAV